MHIFLHTNSLIAMSLFILLLNGVTDLPLVDLKNRTPLEVSKHPYLDSLLHHGELYNLSPPSPSSFENSLLSLLGRDKELGSQAVFESIAKGHNFKEGEGAISCRFVSMGKDVITDISDHLLTDREGALFCKNLNESYSHFDCKFYPLEGTRALCISSHPAFTSLFPFKRIPPVSTLGKNWKDTLPPTDSPFQGTLQELISQFQSSIDSSEVNSLKQDFEEAPVNGIILSEGSIWKNIEKSSSKQLPENTIIVTSNPSTLGIAKTFGIDVWSLPSEVEKFSQVPLVLHYLEEMLKTRDLVIWDVHYLWNSTYNGSLLEKIKSIEFLDRHLVSRAKEISDKDNHTLITLPLTHSSIHLGEVQEGPVPAIIYPVGSAENFSNALSEKLLFSNTVKNIEMKDLMGLQTLKKEGIS